MNSTPSRPHSIIRFTALLQPPPTHTTLIRATGEIAFDSFTSCGPDTSTPFPDSKFFSLSSLVAIMLS